MTSHNITLKVEHKPSFSFALEQSGVRLVGPVYIINNDSDPLEDAILEVALYPDLGEPVTLQLPKIHGGEGIKIDVIDLRLPPGRLEKTLEAERIVLECSLKKGETTLEQFKKEVTLLAYNDYSVTELDLELLACFVTPNHPVIMQVLKQVREVLKRNTGDNSLPGYQTGSAQKVYEMTKALYETFKDFGISYINPPASFGFKFVKDDPEPQKQQKIRFPDQVLHDQMGTCLDLSVLACACLEQMGLYPLLIVVSGHAFIGVWLEEEKHNYHPVIYEPLKLINLIQANSLLLFNSSSYAAHPQPPFEAAIQSALSYLDTLIGAVDIRICREEKYKPLPIRMGAIATPETNQEEITSLAQQILRQAALAQQTGVTEENNKQKKKEKLPESVEKRFQRWKSSLLDLSMKNKLLNLAKKKQNLLQLNIPTQLLPEFENYLASGKQIEILPASEHEDQRNQQLLQNRIDESEILARKASDLAKGKCQVLQYDRRWLYTVGKLLEKEALIAQEETGATTLYTALGLLQWTEKGSSFPKLAPLFLYPVNLSVNRSNYRVSFGLGDTDPLGNVTLVEKIRQDYGIDLKVIAEPTEDESGFNITKALKEVRKIIANQPGWLVIDAAVITTFSFGKFLMWKDLQDNAEILLKNHLVQHIAAGGLQPLPDEVGEISARDLDTVSLSEIPTVVDADSSQIAAVYASLKGRNLVLQGPPGTGKSQTITNLIAAFLAKGKSVLFIAEKMAALEVVQRRLTQVGLGDFCLELHSNKANRKKVIDSLAQSLNQERLSDVPWEQFTKELEQLKQKLAAYTEALHQKSSFGNSLYEMLGDLAALESVQPISLPEIDIDNVTKEQLKQMLQLVEQYINRVTAVHPTEQHPWQISHCCDWSLSGEQNIVDAIAQIQEHLSDIEDTLTVFLNNLSLDTDLKPSLDLLRKLPDLGLAMAEGGVHVATFARDRWNNLYQRTNRWLDLSRQNLEYRHQLQKHWQEKIYTLDLENRIKTFEKLEKTFPLLRWLLQLIPRFSLHSIAKGKLPSNEQILNHLRMALEVQNLSQQIEQQQPEIERSFAPFWTPANTLEQLQLLLARSDRFHKSLSILSNDTIQKLRSKFTDKIINFPGLSEPSAQLDKVLTQLETQLNKLETLLETEAAIIEPSSQDFLNQFNNLLVNLITHRSEFRNWCSYNQSCQELEQQHLTPLLKAHRRGQVNLEELSKVLLKSILQPWFVKHFDSQPTLRQFEGKEQSQQVEKFRQLKKQYLQTSRDFIRTSLAKKLPSTGVVFNGSEVGGNRRFMSPDATSKKM